MARKNKAARRRHGSGNSSPLSSVVVADTDTKQTSMRIQSFIPTETDGETEQILHLVQEYLKHFWLSGTVTEFSRETDNDGAVHTLRLVVPLLGGNRIYRVEVYRSRDEEE